MDATASEVGAFAVLFASPFDAVASIAFYFSSSFIFNFPSSNMRCAAMYSYSFSFIFASYFNALSAAVFILFSYSIFNFSSSNMSCAAMSYSYLYLWRRFSSADLYAAVPVAFRLFSDYGIVLQDEWMV